MIADPRDLFDEPAINPHNRNNTEVTAAMDRLPKHMGAIRNRTLLMIAALAAINPVFGARMNREP